MIASAHMDGVLIGKLAFGLLVAIFGGIGWLLRRATQKGEWPRLARQLGLSFDGERMHGALEGGTVPARVALALEHQTGREYSRTVTVVTITSEALSRGLSLHVDGMWDLRTPPSKRAELRFDEAIVTEGAERWRLALLTTAQHQRLGALVADGWRLDQGGLRRELAGLAVDRVKVLVAEARELVELVAARADDAERLAERVRHGDDGDRVAAFAGLDDAFRNHPVTTALAEEMLADPMAAMRLRAACVLADIKTLVALAHDAEPSVGIAAIRELAAYPDVPMVQRAIARLAAGALDSEVAPAIARALVQVPHPRGAGVLVKLLDDPRDAVVVAALESLGAIGTVANVKALRMCQAQRSSVGWRARDAIAAIHARTDASSGGLALAQGEGGELALA